MTVDRIASKSNTGIDAVVPSQTRKTKKSQTESSTQQKLLIAGFTLGTLALTAVNTYYNSTAKASSLLSAPNLGFASATFIQLPVAMATTVNVVSTISENLVCPINTLSITQPIVRAASPFMSMARPIVKATCLAKKSIVQPLCNTIPDMVGFPNVDLSPMCPLDGRVTANPPRGTGFNALTFVHALPFLGVWGFIGVQVGKAILCGTTAVCIP